MDSWVSPACIFRSAISASFLRRERQHDSGFHLQDHISQVVGLFSDQWYEQHEADSLLAQSDSASAILTWRWAEQGIIDSYDQAVAFVLIVMNTVAGLALYNKAGWRPPTVLLLGTSTMTVASQFVS